jgi:hypothetical protein
MLAFFMINSQRSTLEKIISLALGESNPDGSVKTTVVSLHMSQMREWGIRGGNVEFKAVQDYNNIRKDFIFRLLNDNYLKQRLEPCMDRLVARGEVLWLVTPSDDIDSGYAIDYFIGGRNNPDPEYWIFYNEDNKREIECVVIQEEIETNYHNMFGDKPGNFLTSTMGLSHTKYQVTFVDRNEYVQWTYEQKPTSIKSLYYTYATYKGKTNYIGNVNRPPKITPNPFSPEFPFEICKNYAPKPNKPGIDDFTPIKDSIEDHNDLLLDATKNLKIFYTPTLVTSRDAGNVVEEIQKVQENSLIANSWAGQNGFKSIFNPGQPSFRMPQVVGNIKDGERFGYIQSPDAVSGDQNLFIRSLRELIHWTLGGVDPLGISASATFGEIKSLFGRIENTSMRKSDILLGNKGLCRLLSKIILVEERKCKVAMTKFIVEQFLNGDSTAAQLVNQNITDGLFRKIYFYLTEEIEIDIPGLPPLGQRDCVWRYTKDVFQRTTREMLDASIVYRNEREDGISQEIALSKLYPNMRDDEIRNSMSGFSPRVVTSALEGIGAALQLYTQFMQMPDPQDPKRPWAISLGLDKLVSQGVLTLQKEITYNQPEYKDSPDLDQIDTEINQTLSQLRKLANVRTTNSVPAASKSSPTNSTR